MKELKMCVVLLDMDRLKSINDKYGHSAGDRALMELAEGLKKCFGRGFHVMRLGGGDEFAVVQFDNDPAPLYHRLYELERILEDHSFTATNPFRVSFSYGLACSRDGEHIDDILERCDTLMYERKRRKHTAHSEGRA